jgi:type I restriction enzyme M protein
VVILVFTRGGKTEHTWFYQLDNDGLSLDDKRQRILGSDLPDLVAQWKVREPLQPGTRKAKFFFVPVQDIRDKQYDLSFNRYHEAQNDEIAYEEPKVILQKLKALEDKIQQGIAELERIIG